MQKLTGLVDMAMNERKNPVRLEVRMFVVAERCGHHVEVPGEAVVEWPVALNGSAGSSQVVLQRRGNVVRVAAKRKQFSGEYDERNT